MLRSVRRTSRRPLGLSGGRGSTWVGPTFAFRPAAEVLGGILRRADISERLAGLAGAPERVAFFDMPRLDISSSLIRRRAAAGAPLRYLVPDAVAEYIEREGLYRQAPAYP